MKELRVGPVVGIAVMVVVAVGTVFALPWLKDFYASCDDYGKGLIGGSTIGFLTAWLLLGYRYGGRYAH